MKRKIIEEAGMALFVIACFICICLMMEVNDASYVMFNNNLYSVNGLKFEQIASTENTEGAAWLSDDVEDKYFTMGFGYVGKGKIHEADGYTFIVVPTGAVAVYYDHQICVLQKKPSDSECVIASFASVGSLKWVKIYPENMAQANERFKNERDLTMDIFDANLIIEVLKSEG